MCAVNLAAAVIVVIASAVSAKAQVDQAHYTRDVADYNAAVDRNQATSVRNDSRIQENEERTKAFQLISRQRAVLAARGANIDFGTALQIQEDTAMIGEVNTLRIRENNEEQASALEAKADLTERTGEFALTQGKLGATATMLQAVGSAMSMAGSAPSTNKGLTTVSGSTSSSSAGSTIGFNGGQSGSFIGQGNNTGTVSSQWYSMGGN